MNDDKISVIVPVYNTAQFIKKCVRSIQDQTYQNIEIILVNDGSKDNSKEIVNQLAKEDTRIIVINKKNEGVTSARIEGVKKASGKYIGFVDSDDYIEKDMYELLINNMLYYSADISHCGYKMIFSDGRMNQFYGTEIIKEQSNREGQVDLIEGSLIEPGLCNKLFKKELFDNLNIDLSIKINEDLLMNFYLFKKAQKAIFQDVCKYCYVVRKDSVSRASLNLNKIYDPIQVKKIIIDESEECIKTVAVNGYAGTCINIYHCLIIDNTNKYRQDKKKVRNLILNINATNSLNKSHRYKIYIIRFFPIVYDILYRIYSKCFQKSKYE